jgi:hypothetical protein
VVSGLPRGAGHEMRDASVEQAQGAGAPDAFRARLAQPILSDLSRLRG